MKFFKDKNHFLTLIIVVIGCFCLCYTEETSFQPENIFLTNQQGQVVDTITNESGKLELFVSEKPTSENDFEIKIKIEKMRNQGYSLFGFTREKKSEKKDGFFAVGDKDAWGISSNGYVIEYGKYALLPYMYLNEKDEIKFTRHQNVLGVTINDKFTSYGYLMEGNLFLTINLSQKGDTIRLIK